MFHFGLRASNDEGLCNLPQIDIFSCINMTDHDIVGHIALTKPALCIGVFYMPVIVEK